MITKLLKSTLLVLIGALNVGQFIRPAKNIYSDQTHAIESKHAVPLDVQALLKNSCYDCHSNNTRYPWYAEVQPVGWLLDNHIQGGKRKLNFSEFTSYRVRRQDHELEEIGDMVSEGLMPLPSYLILHRDAKLSEEQKEKLIAWADATRESMKTMYPPDSLAGK